MMPRYIVPVKTVITEVFSVVAESKYEAMCLAEENEDADYCRLISEEDGDAEVDFNQIVEIDSQ